MRTHPPGLTGKTQEILKKIRRIEVSTRRLVNNVFAGEYQSTFRGQGMEFDEVRQYQPGDEIRAIDWNVTARMGQPFVKTFVEERELVMMLLVDVSGSTKGWINDAERESLVLLCEAVEVLGDRYAIYGFSGMTRKRCELYRIKHFDDRYDDQ